ncbi:MAG TPA: hypothetical protein VG841_11560 [Caulobacterales bacterium]|nr:hypothetical protein [Caulobacterales bacterium]
MKKVHGTRCFEIALDEAWTAEPRPEVGGLTFVNGSASLRLYVSGGLLNTEGLDLPKTAAEMNAHALGSLARDFEHAGGKLQRDAPVISDSPDGYEVEVAAEVTGALAERMVLVTILRPWVWALARLSSKTVPRQELLQRWRELRMDLILVEATRK